MFSTPCQKLLVNTWSQPDLALFPPVTVKEVPFFSLTNLFTRVLSPIFLYLLRKLDLSAPFLPLSCILSLFLEFENNETERTFSISFKVKIKFTMRPSNSTSRYLSKRNGNICPHKDLYLDAHSNIIQNTKRWKQPKCHSTNECI